jgi:hypothetical protein
MELTSEQRQRIEGEEQQRLAEEQYRAEVHARLQQPNAPSPVPTFGHVDQKRGPGLLFGVLCFILGAAVTVLIYVNQSDGGDPGRTPRAVSASGLFAPKVRYVPVNQKIATGQVVVKAGGHVRYRINITPEMRDARVAGSFNVSGGSGNDIAAVVATEDEFTNWINGHPAKAYYSTGGKKTTDRFDLRLGPGTYILSFNNRFSTFSDKYVFVEVDLNYARGETY